MLSNGAVGSTSLSFRKEDIELIKSFSSYEEYLEYLYDFYERRWSSIENPISEKQLEKEIDLAYYYERILKVPEGEEWLRGDDEEDNIIHDDIFSKDRLSRSLNRRRRWHSKVRNHEIALVLSKKSRKYRDEKKIPHKREKVIFDSSTVEFDEDGIVSFSEDSCKIITHPTRFPKRFYKKGQYVDKRDKYFPIDDESQVQDVSTTVAKKTLASHTDAEVKRSKSHYFNRKVEIAHNVTPRYAKKTYGKKHSNVNPSDKYNVSYSPLPALLPFTDRFCHGLHRIYF